LAPTRMLFDQEAGGFCSGDSGGPALTVSGATRVVAVLQSVAPDCRGIGLAGRLSAIHDSFVMPVLAGAEPALPSCGACFEAAAFTGSDCAAAADECAADSACSAFTRCLDGCSFESCRAACRETEPAGALLHAPLERCLCQTCASSCITEGRCAVDAPNGPSEVPDPPTSDQEPPPSSGGCALAPGARPASIWLGIAPALTLRRRRGRLEDA
ncbi:MAG TPA: hypothetical protein VFB62_27420, partial [Polyangiaceae bacterium]|nr:hypothetical protein [Polyangiaceae bacterium]